MKKDKLYKVIFLIEKEEGNLPISVNKVDKYDNADLEDFTKNSRFKTANSNNYTYFNIDENNQIRITKTGFKQNYSYRVTLHEIQEDGFFDGKIYSKNELGTSLQDAKQQAAKIYFNKIREGVSDSVSI